MIIEQRIGGTKSHTCEFCGTTFFAPAGSAWKFCGRCAELQAAERQRLQAQDGQVSDAGLAYLIATYRDGLAITTRQNLKDVMSALAELQERRAADEALRIRAETAEEERTWWKNLAAACESRATAAEAAARSGAEVQGMATRYEREWHQVEEDLAALRAAVMRFITGRADASKDDVLRTLGLMNEIREDGEIETPR